MCFVDEISTHLHSDNEGDIFEAAKADNKMKTETAAQKIKEIEGTLQKN